MLPSQRSDKLQQLLNQKKFIKIKDLEDELDVSRSTAVRDLEALIQSGLARRTRGGVVRIEPNNRAFSCPWLTGVHQPEFLAEKQRIVARAFQLLAPPTTLFIDGGSTTLQLCPHLQAAEFRVITNSLTLGCYLNEYSRLEVILTGGLIQHRGRITIGPHAMEVVRSIHADWFIASAGGIDATGLTNTDLLTVEIERQMMKQSERTMILIDHSKFEKKALTFLTDFNTVDVLVTDQHPPESIARALSQAGVEVIVAE
jgi:DeoR/GlpR family transcriptional regulator of sugar metabolism